MTPRLAALVLFLAAAGAIMPAWSPTAEATAEATVIDRAVDRRPVRIASLSAEADEMLLGLVGPERLVCVTYLSTSPDYSSVAESAAIVGRLIHHIADVEPIVHLEPDLVVVNDFNRIEVVQLMKAAGLRVHRIRYPVDLATIARNLVALGRAVGEESRAIEMVRDLEMARGEAAAVATRRAPVRILFLSGSFYAEGTASLPGELIAIAGGENVVRGPSRPISPEEIVFLDPDLVVLGGMQREMFASDPALSRLRARLEVVAWRDVQPPSQFAAAALRRWVSILHPASAVDEEGAVKSGLRGRG